MSESKIRRKSKVYAATLTTATSTVLTIPMFDMAGGQVMVGTLNSNVTQIDLYVGDTTTGPFYQLYDKDGAAVKITTAPHSALGRAYAMPDEVFPAQFIKLVQSNTAGTGAVATVIFKG
jgi:hypothetical protein